MGDRLPVPDHQLLAFMAEHRFVGVDHVRALLSIPSRVAWTRLRGLEDDGCLRRERPFGGQAAFFLITAKGLRAVGSRLRPPRLHLGCVEHDAGLAWLWLAARSGKFGPLREVISERSMRSRDALAPPGGQPVAVRMGGLGAGGRERLHYPDLLLLTPDGKRVAIELELTAKGRTRRERILGGYAADVRIDAVLYLAGNRALGGSIQRAARSMGIEHLVRVQLATVSDRLVASAGARCAAARIASHRPAREVVR